MLIDGSTLEGGGQILRNCVVYSILKKIPLTIHSIRGNRKKPGLQLQHLTGIQLAKRMSNAQVTGLEKDSTRIVFDPRDLQGSQFIAEIPSAGACTLVLQLALPVALHLKNDVKLVVKGGTNVPMSPSADYIKFVLLPRLSSAFALNGIDLNVSKRGFTPHGGGELNMDIKLDNDRVWRGCQILDRGDVISYEAILVGYCTNEFLSELEKEIQKKPEYIFRNDAKKVGSSSKSQLLLIAKTNTGCIFGASALGGNRQTGSRLFQSAEKKLCKELVGTSCVDEYMQDQLIVFMALAKSPSKMRCGSLTLHTRTAIHFAKAMINARFSIEKADESTEEDVYIVSCEPPEFDLKKFE